MSRRWKIIAGVGGGLLVAAIVVQNIRGRAARAIEVETEKVTRGRVVEKVAASGMVQPEVQVNISANVSGRIEEIGVREGDSVQKGDFLVRLDRTHYQAAAEQARATVSSAEAEARLAEAQLDQARRDLARAKGLDERGLSSAGDLESADTRARVAQASYDAALDRVAQARASLEQAQDQLAKTIVYAPMDGVVSQLNSEVGEVVLGTSQFAGTTIMTVADLARMEVEAEVDENDIVQVSLGDTASIEVDAFPDTTFTGVVTEIANTAVTRGRGTQEQITSFPVKVAFMRPGSGAAGSQAGSLPAREPELARPDRVKLPALRPGMTASVEIVTGSADSVLQVPLQAVTMREAPSPKDESAKAGKKHDKKKGKKEEAAPAGAVTAEASAEGAPGEKAASDTTSGGRTSGDRTSGDRTSPDSTGAQKAEGPAPMVEVVFVVKDGRAEARPVKTGLTGESNVQIVDGLSDGEEIVVGSYRVLSRELQHEAAVKIAKEPRTGPRGRGRESGQAGGGGGGRN